MKYIFFIMVVLSLSRPHSGINVVYHQKMKKSHILNSNLPRKIVQEKLRSAKKTTRYDLQLYPDYSLFSSANSPTVFFKDYNKREAYMLLQDDLNMEKPYAVIWQEKDFSWTIDSSRTKKIMGYKCLYATMDEDGFEYEVWFAPELKYSDGPYRFMGLDGLILELETKVFKIAAVELKPSQGAVVRIPTSFQSKALGFFLERLIALGHR